MAALRRYRRIEDDLQPHLAGLSTLPSERLLSYHVENTATCHQFAPHPSNAVAIVIVVVFYTSEDIGHTLSSYHCYLDDGGKRMTGFGSDGEVAGRVDAWLAASY